MPIALSFRSHRRAADRLDACSRVLNPYHISDGDRVDSIRNTMLAFQGDPDMTPDDVIEMLKTEYQAVFG